LAVLPFVNLTGDSSQDYLADGLTEELTTHLARLRPERLAIIARTSAMRYKHARKRIDEIGRDLDIAFAIESSMRRTADGLRVTVQLIRVRDQSHLWANDFDYRRPDPIGLEDSVAGAVGRAVQLRLTDADRTRLTHGTSTNAQAVDAVMHGREVAYRQMSKDSWEGAKRYFEQAVALDSSYALAWAWLSSSYRMGTDAGYLPPDSGIRLARHAVDRALTEDPEVPEAWRQKGQLARLVDWDWTTAMASYQRALDLDPGNAATMLDVAAMESALGHHDEALPLVKRAVVLNPQDANAIEQLGGQYFQAGQLDSAAIVTERIPPYLRNGVWNSDLVQVYLAQGRISEAAVLAAQAPDPFWNLFARALVEAHRGWRRRPDSTLAAFIAQYQSDAPYQVAVIYAIGGQPDSAFFWLDRAYTTRDQGLAEVKVDVLLASLRPDPRYRVLLAKMRLPL
jgi:TolB-like protein/Tfp pilus assembly protein PilF